MNTLIFVFYYIEYKYSYEIYLKVVLALLAYLCTS